jgi:hypothetical protein
VRLLPCLRSAEPLVCLRASSLYSYLPLNLTSADEIVNGFKEVGFVYLSGHGISSDTVKSAFEKVRYWIFFKDPLFKLNEHRVLSSSACPWISRYVYNNSLNRNLRTTYSTSQNSPGTTLEQTAVTSKSAVNALPSLQMQLKLLHFEPKRPTRKKLWKLVVTGIRRGRINGPKKAMLRNSSRPCCSSSRFVSRLYPLYA